MKDLDHFVLKDDEQLILRLTKLMSQEELHRLSAAVAIALPDRAVLLLPQGVEIMAGKLHTPAPAEAEAETIEDHQTAVEEAYRKGRMLYVRTPHPDADWWFAHRTANPHLIDFGLYEYSLTKPKGVR